MSHDYRAIAYSLVKDNDLSESLLSKVADMLAQLGATADEIELLRRDLLQNVGIVGTKGYGLHDDRDQTPWLDDRRSTIAWIYSDAYSDWMASKGHSKSVVRAIERDADEILGYCGDPARADPWFIRGLVMGDVQSGKTASYSALVNKAVDAGYRLIILLTGTSNELRTQTQERLDEAFVGRHSGPFLEDSDRTTREIGVQPRRGREHDVCTMTSTTSDFLTSNAKVLQGIPLSIVASKSPVLLVMKKNKHPLTQLLTYLKGSGDRNYSALPMLLIDDEADNASVNTRDPGEDPATINRLIREVLGEFERRTYCAYTATPFANVFIDPDNNSELFPDNFIYVLNAPTSYIGVVQMFDEDGTHTHIRRHNTVDVGKFFPEKHKKDLLITELPETLKSAVRTFCITCALRDLRKERLNHRTMLINVSLFNEVQERISELVDEYVKDIQQYCRQYLRSDAIWENHQVLRDLHATYLEEFAEESSWERVRETLYDSISNVVTLLVNQSIKDANERLNYRRYDNQRLGRRVVAVGGLTLSRGLTLEGLSTSYFYRHSKAYDTLLQMGRWFGYRPGYDDLCRIWMDSDAELWYQHIATAVTELRSDLKEMIETRQTPRDFSIRVRSHEAGLIVTARNKMRSSREIVIYQSYRGRVIETPVFYRNIGANSSKNSGNVAVVKQFLDAIHDKFVPPKSASDPKLWSGVDSVMVARLVESLAIAPQNHPFMRDVDGVSPIASFIGTTSAECMRHWDIVLQQGKSSGEVIHGFLDESAYGVEHAKFIPPIRRFDKPREGKTTINVNKSRIGQRTDPTVGMTVEELATADADWRSRQSSEDKEPGAAHYCKFRNGPILTLYLVRGNSFEAVRDRGAAADLPRLSRLEQALANRSELGEGLYVGLSIGFPANPGEQPEGVRYRFNSVALKNAGLSDESELDDSELG